MAAQLQCLTRCIRYLLDRDHAFPASKARSFEDFYRDFLYHPRKLWIRKACFQIHLWAGILLSLYVITIALSGSVLVFEDELTRTTLPPGLASFDPNHEATIPQMIARFHRQQPDAVVTLITVPTQTIPCSSLFYRLACSTISMSTFRASCAVATSRRKLIRAPLIPSFVFNRREKPRRSTEVMVASLASICA